MQIDRIFYPTRTLGFGKRISIWTIGCPHACDCCSNPELWTPQPNKDISIDLLLKQIQPFFSKVDGITITGGEPFWQIEDLLELTKKIKQVFHGDILVYSGHTLEELERKGPVYIEALKNIDILVDGLYIDALNNNIGLAGSNNQKIHRLNAKFADRYIGCETWQRENQLFIADQYLYSVGIPCKPLMLP